MKKMVLTKEDGSTEVVYVNEDAGQTRHKFLVHAQMTYLIIGSISLALAAYLAYRNIRKRN